MIKTLTAENFEEEVLKAEGIVFVKFASKSGCQPCHDFKPKFELASQDESAKFCAYERENLQTEIDELEKKYQIRSFPTVLMFENGELKGDMPKYKFFTDRELTGLILDEQKKTYQQNCYVEDLMNEAKLRQQGQQTEPSSVKKDYPLPPSDPMEDEICDSCQ